MDAGNTFAVLTAFAFLACMPLALLIEGPTIAKEWSKGASPFAPGPITWTLVGLLFPVITPQSCPFTRRLEAPRALPMTWLDLARLGATWRDLARLGAIWLDLARFGSI